jgi:hypothetical protein
MDYTTLGWIFIGFIWLAVALYVASLVRQLWKEQLVRCPETGAVTLIRHQQAARSGMPPVIEVERCGLWPDKQACLRTCLLRLRDIPRGLRTDARGLRPFRPDDPLKGRRPLFRQYSSVDGCQLVRPGFEAKDAMAHA